MYFAHSLRRSHSGDRQAALVSIPAARQSRAAPAFATVSAGGRQRSVVSVPWRRHALDG